MDAGQPNVRVVRLRQDRTRSRTGGGLDSNSFETFLSVCRLAHHLLM